MFEYKWGHMQCLCNKQWGPLVHLVFITLELDDYIVQIITKFTWVKSQFNKCLLYGTLVHIMLCLVLSVHIY